MQTPILKSDMLYFYTVYTKHYIIAFSLSIQYEHSSTKNTM